MKRARPNRIRKEESRGFSLLEVLIAMSIMSVGLLALAQMQVVAMKANRATTVRTDAITVGQDYMEKIINAKWNDLPTVNHLEYVVRNGVQYTVVTAVNSSLSGVAQSARFSVTVHWSDPRPHQFTLSTVKTQAEDPAT